MAQAAINFLLDHIGLAATAAGVVILAFVNPFGSKAVERWFSKRPAFSATSSVFDRSLTLIVEPANSSARKRRPLSARLRGLNFQNVGKLENSGAGLQWTVDLSKIGRIQEVLQPGNDYDIQFFFDADNPSEPMTIRYVEDRPDIVENRDKETIHPRTPADFISRPLSNLSIVCQFSDQDSIISRAFPADGLNASWENVHDGKELILRGLKNVEFIGQRMLAEPRYAWVLSFKDCTNLAIRGLTLGHTSAGFCTGGVLKFENCSNLILEGCDLFGSGTHGIALGNLDGWDGAA